MTTIRLAGSGGQGIQLAGLILAEAAIRGGWNVACMQSYGPESRGGASRSDVIIHHGEIAYPGAQGLDILLTLSSEAYRASARDLRPEGLLICDRSIATDEPMTGARIYPLPILRTATELGRPLMANMVALGVLCAVTGIVGEDDLWEAARKCLRNAKPRNRRALEAGLRLGAEVRETGLSA